MYLDKRVEYLQPHVGAITQTVLNVVNSTRDRSEMHRAMFNRFANGNFQNQTFLSTVCLAIAAIHNVVSQKTMNNQAFNFQEEMENSCRYAVQLMYYNYIVHDSVVASYADHETKNASRQYFNQYREMMTLAQTLASFEDVQQQNFNVGYNNNNGSGMRPIVIGNSNGPISGGSQFPNINMGSPKIMSDTDLSDDLAQLGSTIKTKKDPVIDSVRFSPASHTGFIDVTAQQRAPQPQQVQQPVAIVNAIKTLEYTFGDHEMDRAEHRLVFGGNEFAVPVHTAERLDSDISHAVVTTPKDDSVMNGTNNYLKMLYDICTSMSDLLTMVKSSHLDMGDDKGNRSMVVRFIGSYFDILPTKSNVRKYYEDIVVNNRSVHRLHEHLVSTCNRLTSKSSDIPAAEREDVLTLVMFVDNIVTKIVNNQLGFIFGKNKISIDSFIDDWIDLNTVINNDHQNNSNEFFAAIGNKLKATLMSGEEEVVINEPTVSYTHVVSQHFVISINLNSKYLGYKCDDDWAKVDRKNHPSLTKLINSCRSLATSTGEYTLYNLIVTNDLVVYEMDTRIDGSHWIRLMKI